MRKLVIWLLALAMVLTAAAAVAEDTNAEEIVGMVQSVDREVPYTLLLPLNAEKPMPLVVINHGHGGSREENGGFAGVAEALAAKGIASIRMDFPGCGESDASFTLNTLSNMIVDSNACLDFVLANYDIDAARLGIMGYSMGGRIAMHIVNEEEQPYKALMLLAGSVDNGSDMIDRFFGTAEACKALEDEANGEKGYADYTTIYGQKQTLSSAWFSEMRASNPLEDVTFAGPALVMYGDQDTTVPADVALQAEAALKNAGADVRVIVVPDANHGYGFYSDQPTVTADVEGGIADFFAAALAK